MEFVRSSSRSVIVALLLLGVASTLSGFELGARFDLSNLDFARDRASSATTLPGDEYDWGVSVVGSQSVGDNIALELSYTDDPVLRRIGYTRLSFIDRFFSISVGPFFGLFNSTSSLLQSGLTTNVAVFLPGVATLEVRSDSTLGGRLSVEGDYIQELSTISLGFFLPNVIPKLNLTTKRYTEKTPAGERVDQFTEYSLTTDLFAKNVPYRLLLTFAYQDTARQFIETSTVTHGYGTLLLGVEVTAQVFRGVDVVADLESSVYTFGTDELLGSTRADQFVFRLSTGITIDVERL